MSTYLQELIKENLLLMPEAQAAARLPEELQEKAVELSEALRPPNMEKIVSDLLNPKDTAPHAEPQKPTRADAVIGVLFLILMAAVFFSGMRDVGNALWGGAASIGKLAMAVFESERYWLSLEETPISYLLPAPIIDKAVYVAPHKVLLHWKSVGQGCTYRIYRTYGKNRDVPLNEMGLYNYTGPWMTTSAIVDAGHDGEKDTLLGVAAVSADGHTASRISNRIRMDINRLNRSDTIEPAY
jgi:hypothetical protein